MARLDDTERRGRRLARLRWPATAVLTATAFGLGWIGFDESARAAGEVSSATTTLYHVLHLFEFSMPVLPDPLPWQLEVARYLAPAVTLYAAASAVLALLAGQVDQLRARWSSGHVIVAGLGPVGIRAARSLRSAGRRVVAIEARPTAATVSACREVGVIVLDGEPSDPDALARAGVTRASHLLALTADDDANARVAIDARRLVGERPGAALTCFVQVADHGLVELLERLGVAGSGDRRVRVEPLNLFDLAARTILDRYAPFDADGRAPTGPPSIVLVGLAGSGAAMLAEVARRWQRLSPPPVDRLPILLLDVEALRAAASFADRWPGLAQACRIEAHDVDPSAAGHVAAALVADGQLRPTGVYICLGNDAVSLNAGLTVRHVLGTKVVPIVVQTIEEGGSSALLADEPAHPVHREVEVVSLLDVVSDPDLLLTGWTETIARATHAEYVQTQRAAGVTTATAVPWEQLSPSMRESNRRQAADIGRKLQAVGCVVESLGAQAAAPVEFTRAEIETMARLEHDRWMADRRADGWRPGSVRDDARRLTPYLVPYQELPEPIKDLDRIFVRAIPARLGLIGFEVRRSHAVTGAAEVTPPERQNPSTPG